VNEGNAFVVDRGRLRDPHAIGLIVRTAALLARLGTGCSFIGVRRPPNPDPEGYEGGCTERATLPIAPPEPPVQLVPIDNAPAPQELLVPRLRPR